MSPGPRHTAWRSRSGTSRPITDARRSASFTSSGRRSMRARSASSTVSGTAIPPRRVRLLGDGPAQLLEEERVALGLAQDRGRQRLVRGARRQERLDDALAVAPRERLERELGRVGLVHPGRAVAGPVRQEREDGRPRRGLEQRGEALLGRAVDPLEVLAHEDDRPLAAAPETHLAERVHRPGLDGLGLSTPSRSVPSFTPEEVVQVRRPFSGSIPSSSSPARTFRRDRRRAVALRDPEAPPEDRDDGQVGDRAPVREAVALEPGDALAPEAPAELEEQPGLARCRLRPRCRRPARARRRRPRGGRAGARARGSGRPGPSGGGPTRARRARPRPAGTRDRRPGPATGAGTSANRRSRNGAAVSETMVRSGSARRTRASSACQARRLPSSSSRMSRPACPTRSWVDVDAQPDGDPRRLGPPPSLDGLADRHRGVRGPARRVLDGLEAEGRHDTGGAEVLDAAAEAPRLLDEHLEQPARGQSAVVAGGPSITARRSVTRRGSQRRAAGGASAATAGRGRSRGRRRLGRGPGGAGRVAGRSRCLAIR